MKQEERTRITREKILDAAMEVFGNKGFEAGSIGDICGKGEINRGLLYHNYESKEVLYLACLKESCDELARRFEKGNIDAIEDAGEMAKAYLAVRAAFVRECPAMSRIVFECMVNPPEKIRGEVKDTMKELDGENRTFCRSLLSRLELREGVGVEDAMEYISLVQYAFNSSFSLPENKGEGPKEHEKKLGAMLSFALFGIAERPAEQVVSKEV